MVPGSSEIEELFSSSRVISECAHHATGGSPTARLAHSSHGHTHVPEHQKRIIHCNPL